MKAIAARLEKLYPATTAGTGVAVPTAPRKSSRQLSHQPRVAPWRGRRRLAHRLREPGESSGCAWGRTSSGVRNSRGDGGWPRPDYPATPDRKLCHLRDRRRAWHGLRDLGSRRARRVRSSRRAAFRRDRVRLAGYGLHLFAGGADDGFVWALAGVAGGERRYSGRAASGLVRKFGNENRAAQPRLAGDRRGRVDATAPERGGPCPQEFRQNAIDLARVRAGGAVHRPDRAALHEI